VSDASGDGAVPADPAWRGLYLAGGLAAWLYVLLAVVVTGVMTAVVKDFWDILIDGHRLLRFIADGHEVYWHVLQGLVLMTSILLVVTFISASIALLRVDRVLAALGGILLVVSQILFMAYYPVLLGMVYLAGEYEGATPGRQNDLAVSAEALIAQNSGFNPVYEAMMGAGALLLGLAMLKGVFGRWSAYLGIGSFIAVVAAMTLYPIIGLGYLFWWAVFVLWLLTLGWDLVRLRGAQQPTPRASESAPASSGFARREGRS
jgi:hypothetical protein